MVQVGTRIDEKTRDAVLKVFENYGLDMATGIRMFLKKVENSQELPFTVGKKTEDYTDKHGLKHPIDKHYKFKETAVFKGNPDGSISPVGEISDDLRDWILYG